MLAMICRSLTIRNYFLYNIPVNIKHIACLPVIQNSNKHFENITRGSALHTGKGMLVKMYVQQENAYAHGVMSSIKHNYSLVNKTSDNTEVSKDTFDAILMHNWNKYTPSEMVESFDYLAKYAVKENISISSKQLDGYIDALTDSMQTMSEDHLEQICLSLGKWPEPESVNARNFIEVWAALDDVFSSRVLDWDASKLLLFSDHFYHLHLSKQGEFMEKSLQKLTRKYKKLTPQQLVQSMFFVASSRRPPNLIHNFETRLETCFDSLTIDELAIMCMGFFKSKTPIRNPLLLQKIMRKVIVNAQNINQFSLSILLKTIRYSIKVPNGLNLIEMLNALTLEVPRLSLMCCVHVALAGTTIHAEHLPSLTAVSQKLIDDPSLARLKDLERLSLALGMMNFTPPTTISVFDVIVNELRDPKRQEEISKYIQAFIDCLSHLSIQKVYPLDLIDKVLKDDYVVLKHILSSKKSRRGNLNLDKCVEIECEDYKGNRLTPNICKKLTQQLTDHFPVPDSKFKLNMTEQITVEARQLLGKMRGGEKYVHGEHVLPHYQRGDIIFCNDMEGNPVQVDHLFPSKGLGSVRWPPIPGQWFAIVVAGKNGFTCNTKKIVGILEMKVRQLTKLGYKTTLIPWFDWHALGNESEKIEYLKKIHLK